MQRPPPGVAGVATEQFAQLSAVDTRKMLLGQCIANEGGLANVTCGYVQIAKRMNESFREADRPDCYVTRYYVGFCVRQLRLRQKAYTV